MFSSACTRPTRLRVCHIAQPHLAQMSHTVAQGLHLLWKGGREAAGACGNRQAVVRLLNPLAQGVAALPQLHTNLVQLVALVRQAGHLSLQQDSRRSCYG